MEVELNVSEKSILFVNFSIKAQLVLFNSGLWSNARLDLDLYLSPNTFFLRGNHESIHAN